MKNRMLFVVLLSILLGYTAQAFAVSEEVIKRLQADLSKACARVFLSESDWGGVPTGYQTVRTKVVFAIGEFDSIQHCAWAWTGLMSGWENAEQPALNKCNSALPQGAPPCEIYAHGNEIVYVSVHEKLKKAKAIIDTGNVAAGKLALDAVGNGLPKLTRVEQGEYEYLLGKVLVSTKQEKDRDDAIAHFNKSWTNYANELAAVEEGNLRIAVGNINKDWSPIRTAYEYFLKSASAEQKSLHPEAEQNLKLTEPHYLADQSRKEEAAREQARLKAIEAERNAQQQAAIEKERIEQEKIDAPRKKREAEQLARQQKLDEIKAEREAKAEAKREAKWLAEQLRLDAIRTEGEAKQKRLAALKAEGEAKKLAEQQRLDALKAEREAKQQEKIRLAEEKRLAATGDGSPDDKTCKSYGAKPGSQGYINCRVQLTKAKQAADAQQAAQKAASEAVKQRAAADFVRYKKCAEETKSPACFNNAGVAAQNFGEIDTAKLWHTVAARFGEANAISNLQKLGAHVPAPDLLQQQQQQQEQASSGGDDALGALFGAFIGAQLRPRPPPPQPKVLHCSGMNMGSGMISGTCQ